MRICAFCGQLVPQGRASCQRCGGPVSPDPVRDEVDERTSVRRPVIPPAAPTSAPPFPPVWSGTPAIADPAPPPAPPPPVVAASHQPWPPAPPLQGLFLQSPVQPSGAAESWDWERQTAIVLILGIANGLFSVPQYLVMQAEGFHGDFDAMWAIAGVLEASLGFFLARIVTACARACRGTTAAMVGWVGVAAWGVLALLEARIWDAWSTLGALGIIAGLITGRVANRLPLPDPATRFATVAAVAGVPMIAASTAVGPPAAAALVGIAVTLGNLRQGRPPGVRNRVLLVVAVVAAGIVLLIALSNGSWANGVLSSLLDHDLGASARDVLGVFLNLLSMALAGAVAAVLKWSDEPLLAWLERPAASSQRTPPPPI